MYLQKIDDDASDSDVDWSPCPDEENDKEVHEGRSYKRKRPHRVTKKRNKKRKENTDQISEVSDSESYREDILSPPPPILMNVFFCFSYPL